MDKNTYYLTAASTISHQDTFGKTGFSVSMGPVVSPTLITPDYKGFIDAGLLRRMSKILRMAVACSKDCLSQAGLEQPDAIVTGTGLGCLQDTDKFLNTSLTVEGLLPPTSFIQSTHNTMAGQISLSLGNHGYNMTHTQNTLSFEHALVDALLLLEEGAHNILVGAADEHIDILSEIAAHLSYGPGFPLTSGASFFMVSKEKTTGSVACIKDCEPVAFAADPGKVLKRFLNNNDLEISNIDRILYALPVDSSESNRINSIFGEANLATENCINYLSLSGVYPTASAFALNYAADLIAQDRSPKNILIFNALRKENLGLTLVQAVEA